MKENHVIMFSSQPEADLMMISTLLLPCVLFGTLKVDAEAVYYYDSSNYKIINYVAKCAGNLSFKLLFYKHIYCI